MATRDRKRYRCRGMDEGGKWGRGKWGRFRLAMRVPTFEDGTFANRHHMEHFKYTDDNSQYGGAKNKNESKDRVEISENKRSPQLVTAFLWFGITSSTGRGTGRAVLAYLLYSAG